MKETEGFKTTIWNHSNFGWTKCSIASSDCTSPPKPLRLVLDSTRTNTLLYTGKLMIPHVVDLLLRFCFHKYFFQWDEKSMYISVQKKVIKDSLLFQYLYIPMNDDRAQLLVYSFRYVVMGSKDASFKTASCIEKIADIVLEE